MVVVTLHVHIQAHVQMSGKSLLNQIKIKTKKIVADHLITSTSDEMSEYTSVRRTRTTVALLYLALIHL